MADELLDRLLLRLPLERRQAVEDEEGALGRGRELRPAALPPVPAPTGHAHVDAPDDLSRARRAVSSVERLIAAGMDETQIALKSVEILTAHRNHVPQADRVVGVDERAQTRQRPSLEDPRDERLRRRR